MRDLGATDFTLTAVQGEWKTFVCRLKKVNDERVYDGVGILVPTAIAENEDLTGADWRAVVKRNLNDPDAAVVWAYEFVGGAPAPPPTRPAIPDLALFDPPNGDFALQLTPNETNLTAGDYFIEISFWLGAAVYPTDPPNRRIRGKFVVQKSVDFYPGTP